MARDREKDLEKELDRPNKRGSQVDKEYLRSRDDLSQAIDKNQPGMSEAEDPERQDLSRPARQQLDKDMVNKKRRK